MKSSKPYQKTGTKVNIRTLSVKHKKDMEEETSKMFEITQHNPNEDLLLSRISMISAEPSTEHHPQFRDDQSYILEDDHSDQGEEQNKKNELFESMKFNHLTRVKNP